MPELTRNTTVAIEKEALTSLIATLQANGYQTIGPRVEENTLVNAPVDQLSDFPIGYTSQQEKSHFRLNKVGHKRYFDSTPGQASWKPFLFPPRSQLFKSIKENGDWKETLDNTPPPKLAFIGVRPCDMAAILIQDNVFIRDDFTDPIYQTRRQNLLIITVNCLRPAATCFCRSMGTGPKANDGFDLSLTELDKVFLVEIGSDAGLSLMQNIPWELASAYHLQAAKQGLAEAKRAIQRKVENLDSLPDLLLDNLDHPRWNQIGERCLSCANCTQVCPTCFCWDTVDNTNLSGDQTERVRIWDSCFNPSYSAQAGGNTRPSTKARYRQWLTHKMSTWTKQFDTLGCTGCGRCIVWCPAQIDITEEINAFQEALA